MTLNDRMYKASKMGLVKIGEKVTLKEFCERSQMPPHEAEVVARAVAKRLRKGRPAV